MRIDKLGEFGLIERFQKNLKTDSSVIVGSGDDCAVLRLDKKQYQLFTCDMLVEGVDFDSRENPYLIGRKSLAVSISDIASCSGLPKHCLVSLGLPKTKDLSFVDSFFKGMQDIAKHFRVNIAGGDLSCSEKLVIDVSMLGVVEKERLTLRRGAKEGDIIFVTGELGGSIKGKHLNFEPRIKEARFLAENFKINSMIDISDGLTQDLGHIASQSKLGAVIYEDLIPFSRKASGLSDALYSGEDFELLFTLPAKEAKRLLEKELKIFQPIGQMLNKKYGLLLQDKKKKISRVIPKGFRHF